MSAVAEKRKDQRHICAVPIEGKVAAFSGSQTIDMSKSGAGLMVNKYVPINTEMAVEIELTQEGEPILALGQVKWVQQIRRDCYRVGLFFKDIEGISRSRLNKYLRNS